ncbi:hypothetical protein VTL71DRAFT_6235 [Oculimacula yallundae]|uniref:F-box domain-containing protein n=1 Tax=Oculimacula yallundae TaxID=86028 RepID=A0ABR4BZU2_9HELO
MSGHESTPFIASTASQEPPGLLRLPLELRMQIYSHLVPDTTIPSSSRFRPLRMDGGACAPALFAVNRRIHDEMLEAWYKNPDAIYIIAIGKTGLKFLGQTADFESDKRFLGILRRVKTLKIQLQAMPLPEDERLNNPLKAVTSVVDALQPGKCALQHFTLNISATLAFCVKSWYSDERSKQALDFNTSLFLGLAGQLKSAEATFYLSEGLHQFTIMTSWEYKLRWAERLRTLLENFKEQMIRQIDTTQSHSE